jgi:hypothetical protein
LFCVLGVAATSGAAAINNVPPNRKDHQTSATHNKHTHKKAESTASSQNGEVSHFHGADLPPARAFSADSSATTADNNTFFGRCPGQVPGAGAPKPQRMALARAFYHWGAGLTGCPLPAVLERQSDGIYYTVGKCGPVTQSLALADPVGHGVLLLQQGARYALHLAQDEHILLWANTRQDSERGDYYLLQTTEGSYVLIRETKSGGTIDPPPAAQGACDPATTEDIRYTAVPPALIEPWADMAADGWIWPVQDGPSGPKTVFYFHQDDGRVVAKAICSDAECKVYYQGQILHGKPSTISAGRMRELAPPKSVEAQGS